MNKKEKISQEIQVTKGFYQKRKSENLIFLPRIKRENDLKFERNKKSISQIMDEATKELQLKYDLEKQNFNQILKNFKQGIPESKRKFRMIRARKERHPFLDNYLTYDLQNKKFVGPKKSLPRLNVNKFENSIENNDSRYKEKEENEDENENENVNNIETDRMKKNVRHKSIEDVKINKKNQDILNEKEENSPVIIFNQMKFRSPICDVFIY